MLVNKQSNPLLEMLGAVKDVFMEIHDVSHMPPTQENVDKIHALTDVGQHKANLLWKELEAALCIIRQTMNTESALTHSADNRVAALRTIASGKKNYGEDVKDYNECREIAKKAIRDVGC